MTTLATAREESRSYQLRAADPANSAWVSANAGTGKTYVLVLRVLRLLLSGAAPSSILCLTFTKAAAAEMSNRLIARLGDWAAMPNEELTAELGGILQREAIPEELELARCLFARVLDAPGGLNIMTIHAFCDRVLRRFPLEAGVSPGFTILTDEDRAALLGEASDAVLRDAAGHPRTKLGAALAAVVSYAGEGRFQELLREVIARQDALLKLIREQDDDADPFAGIDRALRTALGVKREDTADSIISEQAATASDALIAAALTMLRDGKPSDHELAVELGKATGKSGNGRREALAAAFLTDKGAARSDSRFVTKALREAYAGTADALCRARDAFAALEIRRCAVATALATTALLRLAEAVIERYEAAKADRLAMDFDGLIAKTAGLFQRSDAAAWVLFRLDADLRHILVDEAQDTSPRQWELVRALTAEFFAGDGAEGEQPHTMFAVGDEKQSIYGFQGADPRQFAGAGRDYSARARAALLPWVEAPLTLSFRTTRAVLEAVDRVFADAMRTPGLTADSKQVRHFAHREGEAGLVEIWQPEKAEEQDAAPVWEPFAEAAAAPSTPKRLATRIARQIRHWLDSGETLASLGRPVRAGDILILVRKRTPFAGPMVRELKAHGIPVAGADRMRLTEQLLVMDLMALGDALLLPEDDLTLAALLKSPAFGFGEAELFAAAHDRKGPLWDAMAERAALNPAYGEARQKLEAWRIEAARMKPFDFYMARLEKDGMRRALLDRLGPDAADAIDEFLNLALTYETSETPTLQGFLHWLRVASPEIKRDMEGERDEVRVMTVHGSKGLEANIVILADTCSARSGGRGAIIELAQRGGRPNAAVLPVWTVPGSRLVPEIAVACEAGTRAEREEYQRLLYVAMTRARDRLYVAGFEGRKPPRDKGCWYDLISAGLEGALAEGTDFAGNPVRWMECPQELAPKAAGRHAAAVVPLPLPDWHGKRAAEGQRSILVNPSRLDIKGGAPRGGGFMPREEALARGVLLHRLLEQLPGLPLASRERAGRAFLDKAAAMAPAERDGLLSSVLRILVAPDFGGLFGPDSRAEAPLTAKLPALWAGGPPMVISGQADRLVIRSGEALILDFKSGSAIPRTPEETPEAYLAQLAAYRLALSRLFPGKVLRAALLWTEMPQLMPISAALIDRGEWLLYESVRARHLD